MLWRSLFDDDLRAGQLILRLAGQLANAGSKNGNQHQYHGNGADHEKGEFDRFEENKDQAAA